MSFEIHVLLEARPSAHLKTRTEDTPRGIHHAAHLTYSASVLKIGGFVQSQIRKIAYVALS